MGREDLTEIVNGNIKLYKALEKEHAHFIESGSILFGSFRKYRDLEKKWIGDPLEGRIAHVISSMNTNEVVHDLEDGYLVVRNPHNPKQILLKVRAGPGSNNKIKDFTFLGSHSNLYILCVSVGPLEMIRDGWVSHPEASYEDPAIFLLRNVKDFCRYIVEKSTVIVNGKKFDFRDKFKRRIDFNVVRYQNVVHPFSGRIDAFPDPFVKSPEFYWQREARFVIDPLVDDMPESVNIAVDGAYFQEV